MEPIGWLIVIVMIVFVIVATNSKTENKEIPKEEIIPSRAVTALELDQIRKLDKEMLEYKTMHLVHLLLTLATGIWVFVWMIVTSNNSRNRERIQAEIDRIMRGA